jgi:hypothetical protein
LVILIQALRLEKSASCSGRNELKLIVQKYTSSRAKYGLDISIAPLG